MYTLVGVSIHLEILRNSSGKYIKVLFERGSGSNGGGGTLNLSV